MKKQSPKLTPQQERFCEEFLIDLNSSAAAERAGYSKKSIRSIASELMSKEQIQEKISELKSARSQRTNVTADYVIDKLKQSLDLDLLPLLNAKGEFKPLKDLPEDIRKLITSVDTNPFTGEVTGYKFINKTKALSMLAVHTGVTTPKVEVDVGGTLEGLLAGVARMKENESSGSD